MRKPQRETVALLLTDVENYSGLCAEDESRALASLRLHDSILNQAIPRHGGKVFSKAGDAFHAVFADPDAALTCALDIQTLLRKTEWKKHGPELRVRIAVHAGTPELRDNDYFGQSVNLGCRVRDIGHGGQVLVTAAVHDMLAPRPSAAWSFKSLDAWKLKGVPAPEVVYQVVAGGHPQDFPPLRAVPNLTSNLPDILSPFYGREEMIGRLRERIEREKLIVLRGAGGCGKTCLAIETSRPLPPSFPGGVWLVRLDPLADPRLVASEIARVMKVHVPAGTTPEEALVLRVTSRPALIVLDNCEHLRQGCAKVCGYLLAACRDLRILATSREPLGVPGEVVIDVPPLSLPKGGARASFNAIRGSEAVQLFVGRAEAAAGFALTRDNAPQAAEICCSLAGIPLALELAARWVGVLPLPEIAAELANLVNEPVEDDGLVPDRQRTMGSTVEWSLSRLDESERALLLRLSTFRGGCTLEAARAVCPDAARALTLIRALVDRSLVMFDEHAKPDPRYRLLEPIREVIAARLSASPDEHDARKCHQSWYAEYAARGDNGIRKQDQALWMDRLEADHDNLRAALKWAVEPESRLHMAMSLHLFWLRRGFLAEGRGWLEGALNKAARISDDDRARAMNVVGAFAWMQNDLSAAGRCYQQSLEVWDTLGNRAEAAKVLNNLGLVARDQRDFDAAAQSFQKCLQVYRDLGDEERICAVLSNLGGALCDAGDPASALPLLTESLDLHRRLGDESGQATTLYNLGEAAVRAGDDSEAEKWYGASLVIYSRLGQWHGLIMGFAALGALFTRHLEWERAAALLSAARAVSRWSGVDVPKRTSEQCDAAMAALRAQCDTAVIEAAMHRGQLDNMDDVMEFIAVVVIQSA